MKSEIASKLYQWPQRDHNYLYLPSFSLWFCWTSVSSKSDSALNQHSHPGEYFHTHVLFFCILFPFSSPHSKDTDLNPICGASRLTQTIHCFSNESVSGCGIGTNLHHIPLCVIFVFSIVVFYYICGNFFKNLSAQMGVCLLTSQ